MSRKILCPKCDTTLSKLAKSFNELYESVGGLAKQEFHCDDCGKIINTGDECFASVLLPDNTHYQYKNQKPEIWMKDYILPTGCETGDHDVIPVLGYENAIVVEQCRQCGAKIS